ncbi:polyphosphate--glucose phosphotransferase [Herbidospora mongoliensis]|uniref:polyphosphate--glucose phosphotransferase n=1 Tax=Herbidospora mongoliensis TaxID=688067 RepID=UPI0008312179
MNVLGIDIGGSGIKGAPVDTKTGELMAERLRIPTPQPATPKAIAEVVSQLVDHFKWTGPVGVTFPGVVVDGEIRSAANVDKSWIGVNAQKLFGKKLKSVMVINDADAAGMAEMAFGAGKNNQGVVLVLTIGTGIGSALFMGGKLVPNTEFGHIELKGKEAESRASDAARDKRDMSWDKYAKRIGQYLRHMEMLFSPALMVVGGGISKKSDKFMPMVDLRTKVVPAKLLNEAGIIGGALAAEMMAMPSSRTTSRTGARRTTAASSRPRTARATTGATRSAARRATTKTTPNRSSSRTTATGGRKAASTGTSRSTTGRTTTSRTTGARSTGTSRTPASRSTAGRSTTSRTTGARSTGTTRTPAARSTGTSRTSTARSTGTSRTAAARSTGTSRTSAARSNGTAKTSAARSTGTSRTSAARSNGASKTPASRSTGTTSRSTGTTSRSRTGTTRSTGASGNGGTTRSTARRTTKSAGGTTRRAATPSRRTSATSRRMRG